MSVLSKLRKMVSMSKKLLKADKKLLFQRFFYQSFCNRLDVDHKIVLIESFHGQNISDSGLEFAKEILRLYPNKYRVYFASENLPVHTEYIKRIGLKVDLVDVRSFEYARILATAGYIFANTGLPIYFIKRKGQTYLQTWHGTPLKTLGKQMKAGLESLFLGQHGFLQADYITQPNEYTREIIMRDYNLENIYTGKVVMAGYPRNRVFMEPGADKRVRVEFGLQDKTVFVYMPTWRGTSARDKNTIEYGKTAGEIFKELDSVLTDEQIIYVKFHPILRDSVKLGEYSHIKAFPPNVESYAFLNAADCLITDYSSVFFDFSLTKKPIILFTYDYEEYIKDRGITFDIKDLPFLTVNSTDELSSALQEGTWKKCSYEETDYFKTFFKYDSYDVTERLLSLVFNGENCGFEITDYSGNLEKQYRLIKRMVRSKSELKSIASDSSINKIVWFYRGWFNNSLRNNLYDYYNDSFDYVITTDSCPMTFTELILCKLGNKRIQAKLQGRDLQRTLPNLVINEIVTEPVAAFDVGCRAAIDEKVEIYAETVSCTNGGKIVIECNDPIDRISKSIKKVYLSKGYTILHIEELTKEEQEGKYLVYDFLPLLTVNSIKTFAGAYVGYYVDDPEKQGVFLIGDTQRANSDASITNSHVQLYRPSGAEYETDKGDKSVTIIPYSDLNRGVVKVRIEPEPSAGYGISTRIMLQSINCNGRFLRLHINAEGWRKECIGDLLLKYRSKQEIKTIKFNSSVREYSSGCIISASAVLDEKVLKGIYWDLQLALRIGNTSVNSAVFGNRLRRYSLYLLCKQCRIGDRIFFPYYTRGRKLAFVYRDITPYDTQRVKFKEVAAYALYILLKRYYYRKGIILVFEKFSASAQDNSYFFFKYCMENNKLADQDRFYYVIDRHSPDIQNVAAYEDHVIRFMSFRHMMYAMCSRLTVSTDAYTHLYLWRTKPSLVSRVIRKQNNLLFLQHGVTALKRVDSYFGKNGSNPVKYFVTVSEKEKEIIIQNFGLDPNNVPITGFARWDAMEDKRKTNDRFILVMPTWRSWLENISTEIFSDSTYYTVYTHLLNNTQLQEVLTNNNCRMVFYLHPKLAEHTEDFSNNKNSCISVIQYGEKALNELIMGCSMLVTDYSSVCWDVLYLDKPVIFYQFDYTQYMAAHGSYIDMTTELPGERYLVEDDLIKGIQKMIQSGMKQPENYKRIADSYIANRDHKNCERIYSFLESIV